METKLTLETKTTDALQELTEANIDSAEILRQAADSIDHDDLTTLFIRVAASREKHAAELQHYLRMNGHQAEEDSSLAATARSKWIELRAAINSGNATVVLIEAERAEDVIKGKYEELLVSTAGSAMNDILQRQHREVKGHHDLIRDLRDLAKAAA